MQPPLSNAAAQPMEQRQQREPLSVIAPLTSVLQLKQQRELDRLKIDLKSPGGKRPGPPASHFMGFFASMIALTGNLTPTAMIALTGNLNSTAMIALPGSLHLIPMAQADVNSPLASAAMNGSSNVVTNTFDEVDFLSHKVITAPTTMTTIRNEPASPTNAQAIAGPDTYDCFDAMKAQIDMLMKLPAWTVFPRDMAVDTRTMFPNDETIDTDSYDLKRSEDPDDQLVSKLRTDDVSDDTNGAPTMATLPRIIPPNKVMKWDLIPTKPDESDVHPRGSVGRWCSGLLFYYRLRVYSHYFVPKFGIGLCHYGTKSTLNYLFSSKLSVGDRQSLPSRL
jgi:hypothetical protein